MLAFRRTKSIWQDDDDVDVDAYVDNAIEDGQERIDWDYIYLSLNLKVLEQTLRFVADLQSFTGL